MNVLQLFKQKINDAPRESNLDHALLNTPIFRICTDNFGVVMKHLNPIADLKQHKQHNNPTLIHTHRYTYTYINHKEINKHQYEDVYRAFLYQCCSV